MTKVITSVDEIPSHLRQAHEDGKVVFFCGAGISVPAGLPGFKGLVEELCKRFPDDSAGGDFANVKVALKTGKFDTAIGLLEKSVAGGAATVREAIADILTPANINGKRKNVRINAHKNLLTLGKNRENKLRLITTNFDRLFVEAMKSEKLTSKKLAVETYKAPLLPVPKQRWDGLVYLHGLLPPSPSARNLADLVVSSADFGRAYLTERWAARFLSELFRNFSVCFVGYGINDPILRYTLDALAADRASGESVQDAFVFAECSAGKEKAAEIEWLNKSVTPILYKKHSKHYYLYKILHDWANAYRDRIYGKTQSIITHAQTDPSHSSPAANAVLWALTDRHAAKHFAEMNPVPPLSWLEEFSREQFARRDLLRFGITPNEREKDDLRFSMLHRPAPYAKNWMRLVSATKMYGNWDRTMGELAYWLTRHLNDPELILWIAKNGGQVHDGFAHLIHERIAKIQQLENEDNKKELAEIRENAPQAIPTQPMRTLWQIVLTGRLQPGANGLPDSFDWVDKVKHTGVTPYLRAQLRKILAPCITVHSPWPEMDGVPDTRDPINKLVSWDLVLADGDAGHLFVPDFQKTNLKKYLPALLPDFIALLREALDLFRELGAANDDEDQSFMDQPSIADHSQNVLSHTRWTALIMLTRDAWLELMQQDLQKARTVAASWWEEKYPLFKRLAFFAAEQEGIIPPSQALSWLLSANGKWLWSGNTKSEMFRLLRHLGPLLDEESSVRLERAFLRGPLFKEDLPPEEALGFSDRMIWLRLSKMQSFGIKLSKEANENLRKIQQRHPNWSLRDDDRDELSFWIESGSGADFRESVRVPSNRKDLAQWLMDHSERNIVVVDNWADVCQEDFGLAFSALDQLAKQDAWVAFRWGEALHVWSKDKFIKESWAAIHPLLLDAPDHALRKLSMEVGLWLQSVAKKIEKNGEGKFFSLCRRFLEVSGMEPELSGSRDILTRAMNQPVGRVTQALFGWWREQPPLEEGQGLPPGIQPIFTDLCNPENAQYNYARTMIAARTSSLYYVDREWTKQHLLPLFNWRQSQVNAAAVWAGFLWHPHLYPSLLSEMKDAVLETADHYEQLGTRQQGYAVLMAHIGLSAGRVLSESELRKVNDKLPAQALVWIGITLNRVLSHADERDEGEEHGEYWKNRIRPYLEKSWPKHPGKRKTLEVSAQLAQICAAAGEEHFSDARKVVAGWLQRMVRAYTVLKHLHEKGICKKHPKDSLDFLDAVVADSFAEVGGSLQKCLDDIKDAYPDAQNDPRFKRLHEIVRMRNSPLTMDMD